MASGNEIKQKIVLEGEKKYAAALKEANRNLKTLKSALRAETAELGANATAQQKAETKAKSLQKQIAEQEKIVKTLQDALGEVREKYADNEDAIAKWETQLNNARTTLADMKAELGDVGTEANTAVTATQSLAESFGKISEVGGTIADTIGSAFSGVVSSVQEAISAVWGQVTDLAARSNGLVDLAGYWNTNVTTIQKYKGAVAEASGTLEDLNGIVTKINSKANSMKREDWLQITSVSPEKYEDSWEFAMAVMDDLSKMEAKQRNAAGFNLFGNGATKAFDLLNDWETIQANLDKYDPEKGGYGLTEEQMQSMSELYDKINGMKESWSQLKGMVTTGLFGQLSLDLTSNAQGILDGLLHWFNAESDGERDAAIQEISQNIQDACTRIGEAIRGGISILDEVSKSLQNSSDPVAQAAGNILEKLKDVLEWFTEDNMNNVVRAFEVLATFWLAGKGLQMATKIAEIVANLKTIQLFGTLPSLTGAGAGGGGSGAGAEAAGAGSLGTILTSTGAKIAGGAGVFGYTLLKPGSTDKDFYDENGNLWVQKNGQWVQESEDRSNVIGEWTELDRLNSTPAKNVPTTGERIHKDRSPQATPTPESQLEQAAQGLESAIENDFSDAINELESKIEELGDYSLTDELPSNLWENAGQNTGEQLTRTDIQGFNSLPAMIAAAAASGTSSGVSGIKVTLDGYTVGQLVAPYVSQFIARDYYSYGG